MNRASIFFVVLAACSPSVNVSVARAPIIGGTADTGDPAVVLLFAQVPGQQSGSLCSAEIVSPHVVLTAAHCVSPSEVGAGAQFVVYPGLDFDNAQAADLLAVKETHFDPTFDIDNVDQGHDIGVAILTAPTALPPLPMNRTALDATFVGKPVRFVGYGLDDAQAQTGAGTKRQTTTTLSDYSALLVHFTDGTHETCNGDSGGPAFMTVNNKEVIVGLTSYGDVNCNQGGYDTRVDALTTFVDGYVSQFDPPSAAPPPDMGHASAPPDMAPPVAPSTMPSPSAQPSAPPSTSGSGSSDDSSSGSSGGTSGTPSSTQAGGHALGETCAHDGDCASHVCGLSKLGTLVCVDGSVDNNSVGCDMSGRSDDRMTLAFLVAIALALSRSLRRRNSR